MSRPFDKLLTVISSGFVERGRFESNGGCQPFYRVWDALEHVVLCLLVSLCPISVTVLYIHPLG